MTKISIRNTKFYHILTMIFIFSLLISNMAAIKIINIFGLAQVSAGLLLYPLLYLINDILAEIYGFSVSCRTVWLALLLNLIFAIAMYLITLLPGDDAHEAFELIFTLSPKIMLISLSSYFFGSIIDAAIISYLKIQFQGSLFALRAIFSTLISSFLASIVFCTIIFYSQITFYGVTPDDEMLRMVMMLTIIKVLFEIMMMPLTVIVVSCIKKSENLDVYEAPSFKKIFFFKQ